MIAEIYVRMHGDDIRAGNCDGERIYRGSGDSPEAIGSYDSLGNIYRGIGDSRVWVGTCENGIVYSGYGTNRVAVGSYEHNEIFQGIGDDRIRLGTYTNGISACAGALLLLMPDAVLDASGYTSVTGSAPRAQTRSSNFSLVVLALGAVFIIWLLYEFGILGSVLQLIVMLSVPYFIFRSVTHNPPQRRRNRSGKRKK